MTESKFETVSSLVDDYQLNDDQLKDTLNDEQMSETWDRYHLIGDVMRDDAPEVLNIDLSLDIASAIAAEPTVLAPKRKTIGQKFKGNVTRLVKPFGQVAIAASAATLMIIGVQHNVAQNEEIIPNQVVQTTPIFGTAAPVSYQVAQEPSKESQREAYIEQQRRFQALLADHNQQLKLKQASVIPSNESSLSNDDLSIQTSDKK